MAFQSKINDLGAGSGSSTESSSSAPKKSMKPLPPPPCVPPSPSYSLILDSFSESSTSSVSSPKIGCCRPKNTSSIVDSSLPLSSIQPSPKSVPSSLPSSSASSSSTSWLLLSSSGVLVSPIFISFAISSVSLYSSSVMQLKAMSVSRATSSPASCLRRISATSMPSAASSDVPCANATN